MTVLGHDIVVLSPHLDDAVLSLGGSIARARREGARVRVVTVLANDAGSAAPPGEWDAACGFASVGEAASARREEDRRACSLVGAIPVWLPFGDAEYGRGAHDDVVCAAVTEALVGADTLLLPGFPLAHADHEWLTMLVLRERVSDVRIGLYVEQPYAAWRYVGTGQRSWAVPGLTLRKGLVNLGRMLLRTPDGRAIQHPSLPATAASLVGAQPTWFAPRRARVDWAAKQRAMRAYVSQIRGFGRHTPAVIALYEAAWGGEGLAWVPARAP